MEIDKLLKEGKFKEVFEKLKPKAGVENHLNEFNNDRKVRSSQVGRLPIKQTSSGEEVNQARIPIPFQRNIVKSAASFLFGNPIKLTELQTNDESNDKGFVKILDVWNELRIDSLLYDFCEKVKSQTEAAFVFFTKQKENGVKLSCMVLSNANGTLYPLIDEYGDMIAFGWQYPFKEEGKEGFKMHLWTEENEYQLKKLKDWELVDTKVNLFKKIPVVYHSQEHPEWWEVQDLIDNFEVSFSKFIDTNRYFASPKYKATGKLKKSVADSKVVELDVLETDKGTIIKGDLDVISWDRAPESLKLEFDTSIDLINGLSSTVDFHKLSKGTYGQLSGTALTLMFLGPILKAKSNEGDYKVVIKRIISIIKSAIVNVYKESSDSINNLGVKVNFTSILPKNIKEIIDVLTEASSGKSIMSTKTAMKHNPFVDNPEEEYDQIVKEQQMEIGSSVEL